MAKKDVYEVLDKDGNVVGQVEYEEGSEEYKRARATRESGATYQVYDSKSLTGRDYDPAWSAKVDTEIDPVSGKITVTGPNWLTKEVINSDTFKQEYSDSTVLKTLISEYRKDPNYKIPMKDGSTNTAANLIGDVNKEMDSYFGNYANNTVLRKQIKELYGTEFNDSELQIATSGQIKNSESYNSNAAIYIPKELLDIYDWSSISSFDPEHNTIKASDLYDVLMTLDDWGDEKTLREIQDYTKAFISDALSQNNYDRSNEEVAAIREARFENPEYKEQLARMLAFNQSISNGTTTKGLFTVQAFSVGVVAKFSQAALNGIGNISNLLMKSLEGVTELLAGGDYANADSGLRSLELQAGCFLGTLSIWGESGNLNYKEYMDEFMDTALEIANREGYTDPEQIQASQVIRELHNQYTDRMDETIGGLEESMGAAFKAGEFTGELAYKVLENVVLLNKVGKVAEGLVGGELLAKVPALSKFFSVYSKSKAAKFVALMANVGVQGVFETAIDNGDLVDEALASGELTPELVEKIKENTIANAIGEFTPVVGRNAKAIIVSTTPGKALDMAVTKLMTSGALAKNKLAYKFFSWLGKDAADAAGGIEAKNAVQATGQYYRQFYAAKIKAQQAILKTPIVRAMEESEKQIVKDGIAYILTGKGFKEISEAEDGTMLKDMLEEMFSKADALDSGVAQNYEYFKKSMLNRLNLEKNFDAILRGDQAKLAEMQGANINETLTYNTSLADALSMEKKAIKNGAKLTEREKGSFFTKESSEYLSYSAQYGRYRFLTGADGGNPILTGSNLNKAIAYRDFMEGKLNALRNQLGGDLSDQLDIFLKDASAYYARLQDYMVEHGYVTKEYADLVKRLRANQGWGPNGENYIPTRRLFEGEGYQKSVDEMLKDIDPDNMRVGKTIADDLQLYKMGNEVETFMDPSTVIYSHSRMMASVAQGQDMWRTLQGNNIISRSIKNFSSNGISEFDANVIQRGTNGIKNDIKSILSVKNKEFASAVRETFSESRVFRSAAEASAASLKAEDARKSYRSSLVDSADENAINAIISFAPEGVKIPEFDFTGITNESFGDWYKALPESSKSTLRIRLGGQTATFDNVKKLFDDNSDIQVALKRSYLNSKEANPLWKTKEMNEYLNNRIEIDMQNAGSTILKEDAKAYQEALGKLPEGVSETERYGKVFASDMKEASARLAEEMTTLIKNNPSISITFNDMVAKLTESGVVSEEVAEEYVTRLLLNKMSGKEIDKIVAWGDNSVAAAMLKKAGVEGAGNSKALSRTITNGLKKQLETDFNILQNTVKQAGAGNEMDLDSYWKQVKAYHADLMKTNGKYINADKEIMDRHIVRAVGADGKFHYFETDPNTAFLVNKRPTYTRGYDTRIGDIASFLNSNLNQLFRLGTTGMDRVSYVNQWIKDPVSATIMGAARPFTDLGPGGIIGGLRSIASDYIPFGQKIFGKKVVERVADEVVESTYEATRRGLLSERGEAFVKSIEDRASEGLSGSKALAAKKRAIVEYQIQDNGYNVIPTSGIREVETYRATGARGEKSMNEARQEYYDALYKRNRTSAQKFDVSARKMQKVIDNIFSEELSKGAWRETFLRKSVYTSQYKNAIEAGNTMLEADLWASRYAMDATTNFGRPYPLLNRFMQNVPYLGAAINGARSFYRLLELDPIGVMSRITGGLILPYMSLLSESLSDPRNLEAYKNIPEYDKSGKMTLMYHGTKISIPMPEELGSLLNPFRHMIEKSAEANDVSWANLITSDILGIFPLDLSGFVELDANTYLDDDGETPIWNHIGRGAEKLASTLMPPMVKSAYMYVSKRDPYTGRPINNSRVTTDDEGNTVVMDSNQSEISELLSQTPMFKDIPASGVHKILNTLLGRSTISVLDGAAEVFTGAVTDGEFKKSSLQDVLMNRVNEAADQFTSPLGFNDTVYNAASSKWNRTVSELNQLKQNLQNDKEFLAVFSVLQDSGASDEKRAGALRTYREKLDEYSSAVLKAATNLKQESPEAYTVARQAQVISLLTLPSGLTYNETAFASELRKQEYYDARNQAIATFRNMGFPEEYVGETILGRGYYDKNNNYQFKIYTPYEIQFIQGGVFGASDEFNAQIDQIMAANNLSSKDMWNVYYSATSKAERKQLMEQWNIKAGTIIYPIVEQYGAEAVLGNASTRDKISEYIFVSNPYKKKEYLYKLFGEN